MTGRFLLLLLVSGLGACAGWWLNGFSGAALACILVLVFAWVFAAWRGAKVIAWLRDGDFDSRPYKRGLWGEVAERVQRVVRKLERQNQDSQTRLNDFLAAIQASPNGVVLIDSKGAIEWCNQTAAAHFGMDQQRDLQQLIGNLVRDPLFADYAKGADFGHEIVIPGRSIGMGRATRLSVQIHPYADATGEGKRLLLSRDVTAVEQAETMRRDFVANVSHEIRTPLTVLAGFVETMQTLTLSDEERARYLELMAVQSQRMQTLVHDLLMLSRLEGSPLPALQEWTPVARLQSAFVTEAQALSRALREPGALEQKLAFDPAPDLALAGSRTELLSAMSNLINNAVRYTPADGTITVQWTSGDDGRLVFAVTDTGPGIADEHIPRLTERFYRVDRSRSRDTGGTGLGLAIVKHVAQRHGAELSIESKLGAGSRFSITFPAARIRPA